MSRTTHPDPLARQLEPLFHILLRLKHDREVRLDPDKLHRQCSAAIEDCRRQSELPQADVDAACFALIALIDELATQRGGPLKEYWQERALLVRTFDEHSDGPGFFDRLRALRGDKQRQRVLRVFYLCLLLGYRGKYARPGEGGLLDIEEACRSELLKEGVIPSELVLAPNGERPYEKLADAKRQRLSLLLVAAVAVLSVLTFAALRLALDRDTQALIDRVAVGG
jgi:type VI secretion system protein ImpK